MGHFCELHSLIFFTSTTTYYPKYLSHKTEPGTMGICLQVLIWATFLGIISTNEALPPKLVQVTRFDFELPPKKGEVFARLSIKSQGRRNWGADYAHYISTPLPPSGFSDISTALGQHQHSFGAYFF